MIGWGRVDIGTNAGEFPLSRMYWLRSNRHLKRDICPIPAVSQSIITPGFPRKHMKVVYQLKVFGVSCYMEYLEVIIT